jgi:hypothetical protein
MKRKISLPIPAQQIDFAFALKHFRATYLQNALFETVQKVKISDIDKQLTRFAQDDDLSLLARAGLRGELLFPVPVILKENPFLLGYYRLLMGYSQKEFYGHSKGFNASQFKTMETKGKLTAAAEAELADLCHVFCKVASELLRGIGTLKLNKELLDDLSLLTVGPQLRGGANNQRGTAGIIQVFEIIKNIVEHAAVSIRENSIEIQNATGRHVFIKFSPDPDIVIVEKMSENNFRNIVAIEIKSGTDVSNIHNRIGEAEKSHQKARKQKFTECWTITNVNNLDEEKAKAESPSTDIFYSLVKLRDEDTDEYLDFKQRILSLTAIAARN